jgi:hypothetical protein
MLSLRPAAISSIQHSFFEGRFDVVVGILVYYARGRGFDFHTVETFVCMYCSYWD